MSSARSSTSVAAVAREAERLIAPKGKILDWGAFADAWRGEYQAGMEEIRSGAKATSDSMLSIAATSIVFSRALASNISMKTRAPI